MGQIATAVRKRVWLQAKPIMMLAFHSESYVESINKLTTLALFVSLCSFIALPYDGKTADTTFTAGKF